MTSKQERKRIEEREAGRKKGSKEGGKERKNSTESPN